MLDDDEKTPASSTRDALVERLFKAILPDNRANEFARSERSSAFLGTASARPGGRPEVSGVMAQIEQLLDESVAANEYLIGSEERKSLMDLSEVDWDGVKTMFAAAASAPRRRSCARCSRPGSPTLARLNPTRVDLYERFKGSSSSTTPGA